MHSGVREPRESRYSINETWDDFLRQGFAVVLAHNSLASQVPVGTKCHPGAIRQRDESRSSALRNGDPPLPLSLTYSKHSFDKIDIGPLQMNHLSTP